MGIFSRKSIEDGEGPRDPAVIQAELDAAEAAATLKRASADGKPVTRADLDAHVVALLSIAASTRDVLARPLDLFDRILAAPELYGFSKTQAQAMQRLRTQMSAIEKNVAEDEFVNGPARRRAAYEDRIRRPPGI